MHFSNCIIKVLVLLFFLSGMQSCISHRESKDQYNNEQYKEKRDSFHLAMIDYHKNLTDSICGRGKGGGINVCGVFLNNRSFYYCTPRHYDKSNEDIGIKIYPNPVFDHINIVMNKSLNRDCSITIRTISGEAIAEYNDIGSTHLKINTAEYQSGVYIIEYQNNYITKTYKFIKL